MFGIGIKWNTEQGMTGRSDFEAEYFALSLTMHSCIGFDLYAESTLMPVIATWKVKGFYFYIFYSGGKVTSFRIKTFQKTPLQFW